MKLTVMIATLLLIFFACSLGETDKTQGDKQDTKVQVNQYRFEKQITESRLFLLGKTGKENKGDEANSRYSKSINIKINSLSYNSTQLTVNDCISAVGAVKLHHNLADLCLNSCP